MAESSLRQWEPPRDATADDYIEQMALLVDSLADGWTPESLITEILLREGYSLTSRIEHDTRTPEAVIYRVIDDDLGQSFTVSLDPSLSLETVRALELTPDDLFICRDSALTDTLAANLALQCRLKTY